MLINELFVYSVLLPAGVLFVLIFREWVGAQEAITTLLSEAGSDMTIAALATTVHIFGGADLRTSLGNFYGAGLIIAVLFGLFCAGVALHIKKTPYFLERFRAHTRAGIAVFIGFLSFTLPAAIALQFGKV